MKNLILGLLGLSLIPAGLWLVLWLAAYLVSYPEDSIAYAKRYGFLFWVAVSVLWLALSLFKKAKSPSKPPENNARDVT
jgi:hypothetical protein